MFTNKIKTIWMKCLLVLVLPSLLLACGGGSSSGGNNSDKEVTECIDIKTRTVGGTLPFTDYTNTCDFSVSLAYQALVTIEGPITLAASQSTSNAFGSTTVFIACRSPSQATDKGEVGEPDLACT